MRNIYYGWVGTTLKILNIVKSQDLSNNKRNTIYKEINSHIEKEN